MCAAGWAAPAQPAREDRQPQRPDVRQIMRRVGQQRQASGPQASGEFDQRDAKVKSRTGPQPAVEVPGFSFVMMVRHGRLPVRPEPARQDEKWWRFSISPNTWRDSRECSLLYQVSVGVYPKRAQRDQKVTMKAPLPVGGLARGMFQHGFGKFVIEVDEQRPVDEKRLPTPGLRVP